MSDNEFISEDLDDQNDVEIVIDDGTIDPEAGISEQYRGLSKAEIITQLEREKATGAALSSRASETSVIAEGLSKLNDNLTRPVVQQPVQQTPTETEAEFRERVNREFIDDPFKIVSELVTRKVTPDIQRIAANNLAVSKKFAVVDPDVSFIIQKYGQEVDEALHRFTPLEQYTDADIYKKAAQVVKNNHIDDIVAQRVAEELEKRLGPAGQGAGNGTIKTNSYSETTTRPNRQPQRITLKSEDVQRAHALGMTEEDYGRMKYGK